MDLMHKIVAMVSGAPKRVLCLTCNSEHNYRAPHSAARGSSVHIRGRSAEPKPPAAQRVTLKVRAEQERVQAWSSKTLGQTVDAFTRYAMDKTFREGQLILHAKFGEGYVEHVLEDGKVSIQFREGPKTLAHRSSAAGTPLPAR